MNRQQRRAAGKLGQPPDSGGVFAAGVAHHQAGRVAEAEACYRRVLAAQPGHADALYLLGVIACQAGRHDSAVELIRRAITLNGQNPVYFSNLGIALQEQGKLDEAIAAYRRVIEIAPGHGAAYYDLGNALQEQGALDAAVAAYRQAIRLKPDDAMAYCNLGVALRRQGKLDEAIAAYGRAVEIAPNYAEPQSNLGNTLLEQGKLDAAIAAYRQAIRIRPAYVEAHANLGAALQAQGRFAEAVAACRQAVAIRPDYAEAHANLGNALLAQGKPEEAVAACRRAIAIKPDHAVAHANLGNALRGQGKLDEAVAAYRRAIDIRPDYAEAHSNLGNALQDQGKLDAAMAAFRRAIDIKPEYAAAHSNLMMCIHYASSTSNADVHAEALAFGRRCDGGLGSAVHDTVRDPRRRLRIGYVSADFRNHPVGYFLARVLEARNRAEAEVYCYANHPATDDMTTRLRACAEQWRTISGISDTDAAALIRRDAIDILVDLSGHTANNRLTMFALRPAPVQVSWLGYFGTTGVSAIDYILADRFVVPEGEQRYFTEAVWHLPGFYLCYAPHDLDVRAAAPPALANGFITFGCFNNRAKISADAVRAWADILRSLDGSRLFLKTRSLADATVARALLGAFAAHGVGAERLILEGHSPLSEMLAAYHRVDIALDPFPFGGGATTAEALWMGVPVVTLRGDRWVGRMSAGMLTTVGLADLVAEDRDDYIGKAITLAGDRARLGSLHGALRQMVEASPFCDGAGFVGRLEAAYRGMWTTWCAGQVA